MDKVERLTRLSLNPGVLRQYPDYIPRRSMEGLMVLDVGCQNGEVLAEPEFHDAGELHGVDVDQVAIESGLKNNPHLKLRVAPAEELPHRDEKFDLVLSLVTLPYTHIPTALSEINRVLKPGGQLFLTLHDYWHQCETFYYAARRRQVKRLIDLVWVTFASKLYHFTRICLRKPWTGRYETYQTRRQIKRDLRIAGFESVTARRVGRRFVVECFKL